jgi:anion-transporting  ArsA/GET3 family ATPase
LILVLGKGGVGRSTTAAAIASRCAASGRKTLLFEANANDRFARLFGAEKVDAEIRRLEENLYAVNTHPAAALEEYGMMVLKFRRVYNLVFENRFVKSFIRAVPGMEEYAVLGKAWFHTTEEKRGKPVWDTVVFDMPASGHARSMLRIPRAILEAVPEGPLSRDARELWDLLRDKNRTAIVMVTLAEEMPTNEAIELAASLDGEVGLTLDRLVVNQLYPDRFPEGSPSRAVLEASSGAGEPIASVVASSSLTAARRELNEHYLAQLAESIDATRIELPFLFVESLGRDEIARLADKLAENLE